MCTTICIIQFIIICLLAFPYANKLMQPTKVKTTPEKHRISAMVPPEFYLRVIEAVKKHKCTVTAYITGAVQERLDREALNSTFIDLEQQS